ncbi:uncharacterized protein [Macrobrachium rosenbergii]|uniref:uncharacterized protein n=1 Tax=Macrobrachium rosenbergii TaxID=79674 RepID=UPI0034D6E7C8
MLGKILSFLAWAGLYRVPMTILNDNSPTPTNLSVTPAQVADVTASFMEVLVDSFVSTDGKKVSYLALEQSPFYTKDFQDFRTLLKVVDPGKMSAEERKSFFINLYNILTIDALLNMPSLPRSTISVTKFWSRYGYKVGPYTLHLDDIEHGILRGNRPHPTTSAIMFEQNDPRLGLVLEPDHRIHSALNCGAMSCPRLNYYKVQGLSSKLDSGMKDFCESAVSNVGGSSLILNSIFEWFSSDFASTEKLVMKFLSECVEDANKRKALAEAAEGRRRYTFHYDWALNAFSGVSGDRVKVTVYLQSLCPDTVRFFLRQLYPTWQDLQDIMDLEFVPFGKARATPSESGGFKFVCQHGEEECYGNLVMTCVQNSLPISTQVEFFHCMFSQKNPAQAGSKCSEKIGIDWKPLEDCAKSDLGAELLYQNGVKTASLKPRVHFIPTIVIDGHYDNYQLRVSLLAFKSQICNMYEGPPHQSCL